MKNAALAATYQRKKLVAITWTFLWVHKGGHLLPIMGRAQEQLIG